MGALASRLRGKSTVNPPPRCLTVWLFCALLGAGAGLAQEPQWRETLDEGDRALAAGDLDRAETLFQTALDEAPADSAAEPRAEALVRLARLHRAQGDYAKPEDLYRIAAPAALEAYGAESPEYARFLNEVGRYYHARRKYEPAESFYMQAFGIRVRALGQEHGDVADSLNNLAVLFENQARLDKAEMYYKTALAIREKLLGPGNVKTIETQEHFARLLQKLHRSAEAGELEKQAQQARARLIAEAIGERKDLGEIPPLGTADLKPPELIERIEPVYTEEARIGRHEGEVAMVVEIDAEGRPQNFEMLRTVGLGLDENAIEAVRQWRFKPAKRKGKEVPYRAALEITFRLL